MASASTSSKKEVIPACSFFLTKKRRYCRFRPCNDQKYCSEHIYLLNDESDRKRIPCPLDPNHTVYEDNVDTHIKKCNKRQHTLPPYYVAGINSGNSAKEKVQENKLTVLTASSNEISQAITKVKQLYQKYLSGIKKEELWHECMTKEMANPYYGIQAQRQRKQQASLVSHLEKNYLLKTGSIYVELGAGKGQLSHWVQKATPDDKNSLFILVEKGHIRHKFDRQHHYEEGGPKFQRLNIDLEHLNLEKVEDIANSEQPVVGMGKHLCGAGTDFALRCLIESLRNKQNIRSNSERKITHSSQLAGVVLAPCCHHRCSWTAYVGKRFFQENNLTSSQFHLMSSMCSWATCSWKGWREQETTNSKHNDIQDDTMEDAKKENDQFYNINEHENNKDEQNLESKIRTNLKFSVEEREQIGRNCKRLIDYGRLQYLKEAGLEVSMKEYIDGNLTPENIVLIAKNVLKPCS